MFVHFFFSSNVLLILVMTCLYSLSYLTSLNTQHLLWFYCRIMFHTKQAIMRRYISTYWPAPKINHKSVIQLSFINIRASSIISVIIKMIIWPWYSYVISCIKFYCLITILVYLVFKLYLNVHQRIAWYYHGMCPKHDHVTVTVINSHGNSINIHFVACCDSKTWHD